MFKKYILLGLVLPLISATAYADMTRCTLKFRMDGWSFVYREYHGSGTVSCRNGQRAEVAVVSRGIGFTLGRSEITDGEGAISDLENINEVYGTYVYLDGHAGAVKSAAGQVMTKGTVSLALSGTGRGFDLGVTLGGFTIRPR